MRREHLNYLKEISRVGSITAASNILNISPQALSSSIRTLEKEFQLTILNRSNQGVTLTSEGIRLMACASHFFDEIEAIGLSQHKKKVQLNMTKEASDYYALYFIKEITEVNHDIDFSINIMPIDQLKEALKTKKINSLITITPKYESNYFTNLADSKFNYERRYVNEIGRLHCLVPKSVAIYNLKKVSLKTVAKYPCVFKENQYDDSASIRYMLNGIATFDHYELVSNDMEYKANLLLGNRISFDFVNELSEWWTYTKLINIIPLKEHLSLHICIINRENEPDHELMDSLEGTIFSCNM